jgi:hypothetical protein
MGEGRRLLTISVSLGLIALIAVGLRGGQAEAPKRLTAQDVIKLWEPKLNGVEDFQQWVASPKESTEMAAATFRVQGPSFERLWNLYADLCGIRDRYEASRFVISGGKSAKGTYVVSDRASSDTKVARGLSVFLLRTDRYTVTATIQPDPDDKSLRGSIAAVTPYCPLPRLAAAPAGRGRPEAG